MKQRILLTVAVDVNIYSRKLLLLFGLNHNFENRRSRGRCTKSFEFITWFELYKYSRYNYKPKIKNNGK